MSVTPSRSLARIFAPFRHLAVPVFPEMKSTAALDMAKSINARVELIGMVKAASPDAISAEAATARQLRRELKETAEGFRLYGKPRVHVTQNPLYDLLSYLAEDPPDLLLLEWPFHFEELGCTPQELFSKITCDVAIVRGPWPQTLKRSLVPLRGGPYAELSLRLAMGLPHDELLALHLSTSASTTEVEAPFRGLASVLPNLDGVSYRRATSSQPIETILAEANQSDLLVLGAAARPAPDVRGLGPVTEAILSRIHCATVVVRTHDVLPEQWTGPEGERAGAQAISLLVDQWFAENTYHADEFDNLERLLALKREQGVTISLALPALNEEGTVGQVIQTVKGALMERIPLLDEVVLIDSNSTDRTREIAAEQGVPVYIHQKLLPAYGPRRGKGEALWKSLLVTRGDIIIWIDTDIVNIHPRFVYGVIGPMLEDPGLQFVKGFYQRPLKSGETFTASGGGRVTELSARPLLNLFYPELSGVIQPLAGEYGGRRSLLERLHFFSGYGVEIGLLIETLEQVGLAGIGQVDLLERVHHNQSLEALSKMSFTILQAVMQRLESRFHRGILEEVNKTMKLIRYDEGRYHLEVEEVSERERPPMIDLPEYRLARGLL